MKLLQVTRELAADRRYGMGRAVDQLQQGLQRHGVDSLMLCAGDLDAKTLRRASDRAAALSRRWGDAYRPLAEVISRAWHTGAQAAEQMGSDITHVHCHDAVVAHGYLCHAGRGRLPLGLTQHGFDTIAASLDRHFMPLPAAMQSLLIRLEREVYQRADWGIFMTELGAAQVARGLGLEVRPPQWAVIPHARRPWQFPDRVSARAQLGWRAAQRILLCVGQLVPLKRMEWVVRAMRGAPPGWQLMILGEGDAERLRRLAAESGVVAPTIAVTDDPRPYLAAADAFTSASATEAYPMAHVEALQAGLPSAVTAVGGVPELVAGGGLLLPDEESGYADGLRQLLADDTARAAWSRRALERARQWPSIDEVATRHLAVYRGASSSRTSRPISLSSNASE